jgi:hypothetical protein
VLAVLRHPQGTNFGGRDRETATEERLNSAGASDAKDYVDDPPFRVPPSNSSLAGVLIKDWADGKIPEAPANRKNYSEMDHNDVRLSET